MVVVRIVLRRRVPEQRLGALAGAVVVGADDLRQRVELLERVALGDALGAERDVDPAAALGEVLADVGGRARVDRAAQDDERAIAEVRRDLVDRPLEDRHRRPEELVDRRADDDDQRVGPRDHLAPSAPSSRRPVGRSSRSSSSAPVSRNGISPAAIRSSVAWLVS